MRKITFILGFIILFSSDFYGQTKRVKITVDWSDQAHENLVEVRDPADNLLLTICNNIETAVPDDNCFNTTGTENTYAATYDLGCLPIVPTNITKEFYIILKSADNLPWNSGSVIVNVAGDDSPIYDGSGVDATGETHDFIVRDDGSSLFCDSDDFPDSDNDGVIDFVDQDDDNDGILDTQEGLELNQFDCLVPSLSFEDGEYVLGTGLGPGLLGAVYRFENAVNDDFNDDDYDVLLKIVEIDNTIIEILDDDSAGGPDDPSTPAFLQSALTFTGTGVPGVTYEFTIVDDGELVDVDGNYNPSANIFRIGGTTWDCDGTIDFQESVRYYNPSAFGLDNPTSLTTDMYDEPGEDNDGAGITAGTATYNGFSTNTILRSYFQFSNNQFRIRMQLKKTTTASQTRLYAMSFTQCDIFDYKAPTLTILQGKDTDGDLVD
ncbi:MAG: hypothetical protein HKN00_11215, partial [Flavobacteriaceae bacterium]|nr:hypothetical protein [Flavobacteriaceae bacterium]